MPRTRPCLFALRYHICYLFLFLFLIILTWVGHPGPKSRAKGLGGGATDIMRLWREEN